MSVQAAMVLDPAGQGTVSQVQDGVRKAANALQQAGYVVDEVEPPGIAAAANALVIMLTSPGIRAVWQQVMPDGGRTRGPGSRWPSDAEAAHPNPSDATRLPPVP
jgi:hypothetical protein